MSASIWTMTLMLGALASIAAARAAQPQDELNPRMAAAVDAAVNEWLDRTGAPSVSVAVVREAKLVYAKAYGRARLTPRARATVETRYAIDSVSKEFTAAAVLILAERGRLSLDDRLAAWFPELVQAGNATVRQVLNHTAGLRDYWPQDFVPPDMRRPTTPQAIIDEWVKRPLDFVPGTDWQYSNTGYVLAGALVERVSHEGLFEFLRKNIFMPLNMTGVIDDDGGPLPDDDAAGYTRFGLGPAHAAPKEGPGWLFGAAELAMRPTDLALWDISLIGKTLLQPGSYQAELSPVVLQDGTQRAYGLGLDVENRFGRLRVGHAGSGSGFLAENRIWPDDGAAVVVLTNNDWATPADLADRIAFAILPPKPPEARARQVFEGFQNGTLDRSLFDDVGNSYLTADALTELKSSLSPIGPAQLIELEAESKRGGMITRRWKILCRGARLEAIERGRADGKLEEFWVGASGD